MTNLVYKKCLQCCTHVLRRGKKNQKSSADLIDAIYINIYRVRTKIKNVGQSFLLHPPELDFQEFVQASIVGQDLEWAQVGHCER